MKRRALCVLLGLFIVAHVAPCASALRQKSRSRRPPRAWLLKLLQQRHQHHYEPHNKTGVWELDDSHCAQVCRLQTADPTYQRECIAQCRTETDTAAASGHGGQEALRRFAKHHSPGTQKAYGEIFPGEEPLAPPCSRSLLPRAGAGLGADGAGDLGLAFEEADTDADGTVSKYEMQQLAKKFCVLGGVLEDVMEKRDKNGDQKLDKDEWEAASRDIALSFELRRFREEHFVADEDGEDKAKAASDRFAELDVDGNGKLEDFELGAGFVSDIMDRYSNATMETEDAAAEMFWDHLDQIMPMFDQNNDGVVTLEEFEAAESTGDAAAANATSSDNSSTVSNVSLLAAARPFASHKAAEAVSMARGTREREKEFRSQKQKEKEARRKAETAVNKAVQQLHESVSSVASTAVAKAVQATAAVGAVAQAAHAAVFGGASPLSPPTLSKFAAAPAGSQQLLRGGDKHGSSKEAAKPTPAPAVHVHVLHRAAAAASHALDKARSAITGHPSNPEEDPEFQKQVEEAWAAVKASTSLDDIEEVADQPLRS